MTLVYNTRKLKYTNGTLLKATQKNPCNKCRYPQKDEKDRHPDYCKNNKTLVPRLWKQIRIRYCTPV